MNKLELNEKLAELYNINSKKSFWRLDTDVGKSFHTITLLIDDSARMFDLMIEHNIVIDSAWISIDGKKSKYYTARLIGTMGAADIVFLKGRETPQAATRYAIAMALVKLAESKLCTTIC